MKNRWHVVAFLGKPPEVYPQLLYNFREWSLRFSPSRREWKRFSTVDDMLVGLLRGTIDHRVGGLELIDGAMKLVAEFQYALSQASGYRRSLFGPRTPPPAPTAAKDVV